MPRNGEGLFPRNDIYSFRYLDPATGRWREKSTGKRNKRDAWREKLEFLNRLDNGTLPNEQADWTLDQAINSWRQYRAVSASLKTVSVERRLVRQVRNILGGERKLRTITPHDVENYQVTRRQTVGPRTVNLELHCLR